VKLGQVKSSQVRSSHVQLDAAGKRTCSEATGPAMLSLGSCASMQPRSISGCMAGKTRPTPRGSTTAARYGCQLCVPSMRVAITGDGPMNSKPLAAMICPRKTCTAFGNCAEASRREVPR